MKRYFTQDTQLDVPRAFAFEWHKRPGAFQRLSPPWEDLRVVQPANGIGDGERLVFKVRMGPIWQPWVAEHFGYEEGRQFCDRQVSGPFSLWKHRHLFEDTQKGSVIRDQVEYRLPLAPLSDVAPKCLVEDKIRAMFAYRRAVAKADIERHHRAALAPKRVAISGASGLVGSALSAFLSTGGHEVTPLVRGGGKAGIPWAPGRPLEPAAMEAAEGLDAVVHLAGESIMGLWTAEKKRRIRDSRIPATRALCESLAKLERKPAVLIAASAIGVYGANQSGELDERAPYGEGFLAEVGREWEEATAPAREAGIRVVNLRIGVVLSPQGGALRVMRLPFSLNLGGRLGDGRHVMSWIALDDLVYLIHHAIATESIEGPLNATAPNPVTNAEFTRTLAHTLGRFVGPPAPAAVVKLAVRELAEEVLLSSLRVVPRAAIQSGYQFQFSELAPALRHLLGRNAA